MPELIKRFAKNTAGRDFAVGDIHGYFTKLQQALGGIGFDPAVDRLFSVGDLVDRGPESDKAVDWIGMPWFHAVRGNHEQMTIDSHRGGDAGIHFANGGGWFYCIQRDECAAIVDQLAELPIAIEIETAQGRVGIVHADCPRAGWDALVTALHAGDSEAEHVAAMCQWSRRRISSDDESGVSDVRAVIVGHTPLPNGPVKLGNVLHIDTAGWHPSGRFTLLNLATLEIAA